MTSREAHYNDDPVPSKGTTFYGENLLRCPLFQLLYGRLGSELEVVLVYQNV